jgi:tetratricopeptide (TPR) repeat protein
MIAAAAAVIVPAAAQDATPPPPPPAAAGAPSADPAVLQAAKDAFKKGSWGEADEAALKVLEADPKQLEALYIAGASERQTGSLAAAETHLRTLVEASPNFPLSNFQLGYVLFVQAEQMARDGRYDPAKARYTEAADEFGKETARNPTHMASLSSRAIALTRAGKLDDAIPSYEAWIAAAPQKNDPVVALASAYAAVGKSTEAMAALDRLPDKSPKAAFDGVLAAASVFVAKKDWAAAVPFLEKAVEIDATSTKALALLTEACTRSGLTAEAVAHLQKLLSFDPTPDEAEAVGEAIKATMGDGKSAPAVPGVEPPAALRIPTPRYPKGQDTTVQTEVLVLALVTGNGAVTSTVLVPNRIWKDIRATGFETEATDAVKRGKFAPGTKNGQAAELWIVVAVKFARQ